MTKTAKTMGSIDWLTIKHFWTANLRYKRLFIPALFVPVSAIGLSVVVPYYISKILGSLARPNVSIAGYIYALVGVSFASVIINLISFKSLFALQPKVMGDLQEEVLDALLRRSIGFHTNRVSGKLVSDAIDYPTAYIHLSNVFLIDIAAFVLVVVLGVILVSLHSLLIGAVLLLMAVMAVGSGIWFRQRMAPFRKIRHDAGKAVTAHISDTIVNTTTVKTFGNEAEEMQRHRSLARKLEQTRHHDWQIVAADGAYRNLALLIFQIAFIVLATYKVRENPQLLATGIFAFSYTITISNRLFQIGTMIRTIEDALQLAMPTTEVLQEQPEILDRPGARDLVPRDGSISFKNVTFHYQDASDHDTVFADLNLTIHPGEKVGLVGPSGGGKTTLTKLLLRFEDIQSGVIEIDGQDIAAVTQHSLRKAIAYVPQEPLLFHRTIAENISYGKIDATSEEIIAAAKMANAHEFIERLPNGYQTVVGERGIKLSGGQRQRVAIARAMLKNAPILVLDEATSALDSESEVLIQEALWKLMEGKTAIVIAHRLSTIQKMDRIVVLDQGRVIEQGSHKELVGAKGGTYARLWSHQSGGFIEE